MTKVCCLLLGLLTIAADLSAASFHFSFSLPLFNQSTTDVGSGTLTATQISGDEYLVTGITGTTSAWGSITGLVPAAKYPAGTAPNDNLISFPSTPYLDGDGISFYVQGAGDSGTNEVNIYLFNNYGDAAYHESLSFYDGTFSLAPLASAVPEPSSTALLVFGFAAAGAAFSHLRRSIFSVR